MGLIRFVLRVFGLKQPEPEPDPVYEPIYYGPRRYGWTPYSHDPVHVFVIDRADLKPVEAQYCQCGMPLPEKDWRCSEGCLNARA